MKSLLTSARSFAALLPLCVLAPVAAQSLGTAAADPWIGRPLELAVPARFASQDTRDECVQADVFYGDQRLPRDQVRTTVGGAAGGGRMVRIAVDAPISEPVVTVSLRAGCASTVTRTYTLLPAMPSGPAMAAAAARSAGGAPSMAAAPAPLAAAAPALLRTAAADSPRPRAAAPVQRTVRDAGGSPRLRLDAWEPQQPSQALLRISAQLTGPGQDAARRATAALLWQALNADPSELIRTSATLQRLEGELAQLRTTANQTRADMAAVRQALEAPPDGFRLSGQVAQALIALVLGAAAVFAFLWWRTARQAHLGGWLGQPDTPFDDAAPAPAAAPAQPPPMQRRAERVAEPVMAAPVERAPVVGRGPVHAPVPADLPPLDVPAFAAAPLPVDPGSSMRVETLAATFQEVEFLTSLGLWGDASDVLKAYVEDAGSPAPVAYFELLRLYGHAGDEGGATAVRRRYAQVFGAEAPSLPQIEAPQGLQARAELTARITRNWGRPQALEMIEDLLFAVPSPDRALSLEAGRDLLCLYQVASELQRQDAAGEGAGDEHGLAPWANSGDVEGAADFAGGYGFGLDLDLGAPAHAGEVAMAEPEPEARPELHLELAPDPLLEEFEAARRGDAPPAGDAAQDPFSAAVAHEGRRPLSR